MKKYPKGYIPPCDECTEAETMGEGDFCSSNCPSAPVPYGFSIRKDTPADLDKISEFFDKYMRKDYFISSGHLQRLITGTGHDWWNGSQMPARVIIAEDGDIVIGCGIATPIADSLVNLFVHPEYRGMGIGTAILEELKPQIVRVKKDMSTGDPTEFYKKHGFIEYAPDINPKIHILENPDNRPPTLDELLKE